MDFIIFTDCVWTPACFQMLKESEDRAISRRHKRAIGEVDQAQEMENELQHRFKSLKEAVEGAK